METIEVLVHNELLGLKGTPALLRSVAAEGYYELTLRFGGNVHRVHLPVATTVVIHKEPEEIVDTVEIER